ncbi:fibronectin type III domain containing protein 3C1-like isoform X1 [Lepus europaeus]|uniref:fibronectin type III domain containing protein 3C1-like isoform X1 n=1 Tax=Lepus europaeus TaxID=9983 RepID=UPI002B45A4E5|nr:fibronectin type III domain containing protein 3C1-like isoform X1 [Lepus europaeus]
MESYQVNTTTATQYTTNYSQMMSYPKRYTRWPSFPQYWIQQIILVQVNPGETLTIKSNDGNIQNIQGPADVPLMSPSGILPPIYLPPGYMSQVVEENGIRKIIIVPQTIDCHVSMPASVPQFILPFSPVYPQAPELMYSSNQGEFPPPYIQQPGPQQLMPPPPPPLPPPPPAAFMYQQNHATYSQERRNYNQPDERATRMREHMRTKPRQRQVGGHKSNHVFNNNSLLVNKTYGFSNVFDTPSTYIMNCTPDTYIADNPLSVYNADNGPRTYTGDNTPSTSHMDSVQCTYTVESTLCTYTVNNTLSSYAVDNTSSTYTIEYPPSTYTTDKIPNNSSTAHIPSTSTSDAIQCLAASDSVPGPSGINNVPKTNTNDKTPRTSTIDNIPSSSTTDSAPNTSISENIQSTCAIGSVPSTSNTAYAQIETNHKNKWSTMTVSDIKQKSGGKQNKSPSSNAKEKEDGKSCCFNIEKPVVSDIQTRSAIISWNLHDSEKYHQTEPPVTFELAISNSGKDGKYENIYIGNGLTFTLLDLQPSMDYFLRVTTIRDSQQRTVSEVVSFSTPGCEPDPPLPPTLINRSKSSLNLQWNGSNDNGSKINSFLLEWDEGKGEDFKSCYTGTMKQHKILKLSASTKYSFRLAAKNNFGLSDFSEIAVFHTSGMMPPAPSPPKLKAAGICNLSLEWCAPTNTNPNLSLTYVLEMEEVGSGLGFKPKYNGEDLSCTVRNLQRSTTYKFRIFAYNMEGRSNSSGEVKFTTCPDKPGSPTKPYIKGKIHAHRVKIGWEPPTDNGGTHISSYSLEVSENLDVNLWNIVYTGNTREFLYNKLQPGTTYNLRVFCTSPVGQSQPSDILTIQTPTLSPAYCQPPPLNDKTKSTETNLQCEKSPADINFDTLIHVKKTENDQEDTPGHHGSEVRCTLGSQSMKCETLPVPTPPSQWNTPVITCKGPTCVVVSWGIPECNGAEITDYRLEWGQIEESMHLIYTGPCLSYKVKGLIPGTTYFCRVQAVNTVGVGMFGITGVVTTPATVPAVVPMLHEVEKKVSTKLASSCIAIQWEEPDCHGSPITGYNIEYGDRKILTIGRKTECVLKNLQPDTIYKIRIQAINHYGLSPFSRPLRTKTKPLPLEPPQLDCVAYGHQSLKLKWGYSSAKGLLSNLINYNLFMYSRSGRFSVIYHGPSQTHKVQRLGEYTQYKFKIQACNEAGEGPLSRIYTFKTTKTPPAILKAPKLHQLNNNICKIKWESLKPIKGDPIIYNLQLISDQGTNLIYKGPNTSFSFSNFLSNTRYRFKVCAGRQYKISTGIQEIWGPYSPSTLFSTHKPNPRAGRGDKGNKGSGPNEQKGEKSGMEINDNIFVLILMVGFALTAILCAVVIQSFLIK